MLLNIHKKNHLFLVYSSLRTPELKYLNFLGEIHFKLGLKLRELLGLYLQLVISLYNVIISITLNIYFFRYKYKYKNLLTLKSILSEVANSWRLPHWSFFFLNSVHIRANFVDIDSWCLQQQLETKLYESMSNKWITSSLKLIGI